MGDPQGRGGGGAAARGGWRLRLGPLAGLSGAAALVVTLGLMVSSCTSAIPPDGEVFFEDLPVSQQSRPSSSIVSDRPERGQLPVAIAVGFLAAMSTLDADVAGPWVASSSRGRMAGWKETTRVRVYSKRTVVAWSQETGRAEVVFRVERQGALNGSFDWRPAAGTEELRILLVKDGGEWRVSNPPEIPQVASEDFGRLFARVDIYFVARDGQHLTSRPVLLRAPPAAAGEAASRQLTSSVRALVDQLLAGPDGQAGLQTSIPDGTQVRAISVTDGVATIDFSSAFASSAGAPGRLRVGQVMWTVTQRFGVRQVDLRVEGRVVGELGPDRFDASGVWHPTRAPMGTLLAGRGGSDDRLLFTRDGRQLMVTSVAGGEPTVVSFPPLGVIKAPSRSPEGTRIAYLIHSGSGDEVWIGPSQGRDAKPTGLAGGALSEPSWTPDGKRVLVLSAGGEGERLGAGTTLWSLEPGSGAAPQRLRLAPMPDGLVPTTVRVSPDGAFVLALGARPGSGFRLGAGGQLYRGRLGPDGITGWSPGPIAPGLGTVYSPVWAGFAKIAFIAKQGGPDDTGSIWVMDPDGYRPERVDLGTDRPPDLGDHLTSDLKGERLVFTINTGDGGTSLYTLLRLDTSPPRSLTQEVQTIDADPSLASR
jgi:hypothetical protein